MPAPPSGEPSQPRPSPNVFLSDTGSTDPPRVGRIDTHGTRPLDLTAPHARLEAHVPLDASIGELLPEVVALAPGDLAFQRTAAAPSAPEAHERPLRARARSVLPTRLTIVQRIDRALRALLTAPPPAQARERPGDIAPPG